MMLEKLRRRFRERMHARNPEGWLSPQELEKSKRAGTYSPLRPTQRIRFFTAAKTMDHEAMGEIRERQIQRDADELGRMMGMRKGASNKSVLEGFPPWMRERARDIITRKNAGKLTPAQSDAEMEKLIKEAYERGDLKLHFGPERNGKK